MTHDWIKLGIAEEWDYSVMALASGGSLGPAVHLHQCRLCGALAVRAHRDEIGAHVTRYYVLGGRRSVEPVCKLVLAEIAGTP